MSRLLRILLIHAITFTVMHGQSAVAEETEYRFDLLHTRVIFFVAHQGFSQTYGWFKVQEGWFRLDDNDWTKSYVEAIIAIDTLQLGDEKWEKTIKSSTFFNAKRYPVARFVSQRIEKTSAKTGIIHGELSLHGITKPLSMTFTLNRIANDPYAFKQKAGFSAQTQIKRSDFAMDRFQEVVGDTVEIRIEAEGLRDRKAHNATPTTEEPEAVDENNE